MVITCTGHSGFLIETERYNFIFDYFSDKNKIIAPEIFKNKKTCVFVSHSHHDHFNKKIFSWSGFGDVTYVLDSGCAAPERIKKIMVAENHDYDAYENIKIKTYGSTDAGVSFYVSAEGRAFFHAGDLNDWYWEEKSTPQELIDDEEYYLRILRQIAGDKLKIDVAFVPEDARLKQHAGRGIKFFGEIVAPKRIIPMHFAGNEGVK